MPTQTFIPLATTSVTADSQVIFDNIPSTYTHLFVSIQGQASTTSNMWIRFNNDSTSGNYNVLRWYVIGTIIGTDQGTSSGAELGNTYANQGNIAVDIFDYAATDVYKFLFAYNSFSDTLFYQADMWKSTSAVTRLDVVPTSGTFTGVISLYGLHG